MAPSETATFPHDTWLDIVQHVAAAKLHADSKTIVDSPSRRPWPEVAEAWERLKAQGVTAERLATFIAEHFGAAGSDLKAVLPPGWHEAAPDWVADVEDAELRALATSVHGLWKTLCRQVDPAVLAHPDRHTLLPLARPFIVPGDRFRECYNWDSYWIIRGLLASGLHAAAAQLLRNLLDLVDEHGFVPNGARRYYANRSQPPLLSGMLLAVWDATGDQALLAEGLPRLQAQHEYWTAWPHGVRVALPPQQAAEGDGAALEDQGDDEERGEEAEEGHGRREREGGEGAGDGGRSGGAGQHAGEVLLSRYHANLYGPRPESLREDQELVARAGVSGEAAAALYCDVASAAESGWDFSSRWFVGGDSLEHTRTTQILPADLNAWLYRMERDIAAIAGQLGHHALRRRYAAAAAARLRGMRRLMWSAQDGCWHDLLLLAPTTPEAPADGAAGGAGALNGSYSNGGGGAASAGSSGARGPLHATERRGGVYASNWTPLWCGCAAPGSTAAAAAVAGLLRSGLIREGGLLTSLTHSGQQWDAPNAWPPLVHMAVEGLAESGVPGAREAAADLAATWVRATAAAWRATGHVHEKLDAARVGGVGGGGEYAPQVGFGWSNGVLLALLQRYYVRGCGGGGGGGGNSSSSSSSVRGAAQGTGPVTSDSVCV